MHCREATGDGAKENYRDRGPKNYRDCDTPQTNPSVPFLAELPRFENSRNVEMTAQVSLLEEWLGARQACFQGELSRFDNSQNIKMTIFLGQAGGGVLWTKSCLPFSYEIASVR
jgi:hypothetical protein